MASQLRGSFKPKSRPDNLEPDTREFIPTQVSPDISNFSSARLAPNDKGSCVKQELQTLWEMFTSWLKPEEQTKEQMISQLVLEQFLKTGRYKDKFAVKEKWESSGRNLGTFMEGLTDECLKPPVMVHVSMQGQEALFSENMTLKEVIKHLKEQSFRTTTREKARTPLQIPRDVVLATGYENCEDDPNTFLKGSEVNSCVSSTGNELDSLLVIHTGQYPKPEQAGVSYGVLWDSKRAKQRTSRYQAESLSASSYEHMFMEVQPVYLSRTDQSEDADDGHKTLLNTTGGNDGISSLRDEKDSFLIIQRGQCPELEQGGVPYGVLWDSRKAIWDTSRSQEVPPTPHSSEGVTMVVPGFLSRPQQPTSEPVPLYQNQEVNSLYVSDQERFHIDSKPFKCDKCPKAFKYSCSLLMHQKRHRNERPFVCPICQEGFYQVSELQIHEAVHKAEKPFSCNTCGRSFSHKTNLQAHERIHTGEKPYTCSLCNHRFRQSSTYHRHLRNYHKSY
ncbi:zinc finger and SCAN domain containing protein 4C-like [Microtus oregoni]|uniref:zinc finger and SCAN domain containing protein 4C-like n=1 Tax=Microtus oregoni TaxID=111838 RepID=UPI001BB13E37|nr:zinc finger and SCAN domain containing protein 4C-like [Microtus oregoni]